MKIKQNQQVTEPSLNQLTQTMPSKTGDNSFENSLKDLTAVNDLKDAVNVENLGTNSKSEKKELSNDSDEKQVLATDLNNSASIVYVSKEKDKGLQEVDEKSVNINTSKDKQDKSELLELEQTIQTLSEMPSRKEPREVKIQPKAEEKEFAKIEPEKEPREVKIQPKAEEKEFAKIEPEKEPREVKIQPKAEEKEFAKIEPEKEPREVKIQPKAEDVLGDKNNKDAALVDMSIFANSPLLNQLLLEEGDLAMATPKMEAIIPPQMRHNGKNEQKTHLTALNAVSDAANSGADYEPIRISTYSETTKNSKISDNVKNFENHKVVENIYENSLDENNSDIININNLNIQNEILSEKYNLPMNNQMEIEKLNGSTKVFNKIEPVIKEKKFVKIEPEKESKEVKIQPKAEEKEFAKIEPEKEPREVKIQPKAEEKEFVKIEPENEPKENNISQEIFDTPNETDLNNIPASIEEKPILQNSQKPEEILISPNSIAKDYMASVPVKTQEEQLEEINKFLNEIMSEDTVESLKSQDVSMIDDNTLLNEEIKNYYNLNKAENYALTEDVKTILNDRISAINELSEIVETSQEAKAMQQELKTLDTPKAEEKKVETKQLTLTEKDAKFFSELVKNSQESGQTVNETVNKVLEDVKQTQETQQTASVSKALADMINEAAKTNKSFRIDFDKNISVIIKVDREGKISAEFLPGDKAVEQYLRTQLPLLQQKFDKEQIEYKDLNYRQSNGGKQQRERRKRGE